jgi:CheY-like chemotaxis protein
MKVMVVDDEQDVRLLFEQRFRKEMKAGQIEFQFELSGEAAWRFLEQQDGVNTLLILSDINMPGMTGLDLLKRIKEKFSHLKVFMITAYGDENNYRTAMASGADGYATKPINFDELKQKILHL